MWKIYNTNHESILHNTDLKLIAIINTLELKENIIINCECSFELTIYKAQ